MDTVLQMLPSIRELFALSSLLQVHLPVAILRDTDHPVSTNCIGDGFIFFDRKEMVDKFNAFLYVCDIINDDSKMVEYVIVRYKYSSCMNTLLHTPVFRKDLEKLETFTQNMFRRLTAAFRNFT